jgi:hypothetical protein
MTETRQIEGGHTMSLIKCPECGSQVSNTAAACPKCGALISQGGAAIATALTNTPPTLPRQHRHSSIKTIALIVSAVANVILILCIVIEALDHEAGKNNIIAKASEDRVALQEYYLQELDSGDPQRISELKATMRANIERDRRIRSLEMWIASPWYPKQPQ